MQIVKAPPLALHSAAVYPFSTKLVEQFTLEDRFEGEFTLYRQVANEIWLPRRLAGRPPELDLQVEGLPGHFSDHFTAKHADQQRVVDESRVLLSAGVNHIVQAPTGYGKTFVGCALAAHVNRYTLVLTTKEDLMGQWREAARNVLGLSDAEIGDWRGDTVPGEQHRFVVALVHSVLKGYARYPSYVYDRFGLVLSDEIHRMGADTFSEAMWWLRARHRVGLSATPYRKDGKDVVFRAHIGDIMVVGEQETLIPKVIMQHSAWKCPRRLRRDPKTKRDIMERIPHKAGRVMHIIKSMVTDVRRNVQIAKFVRLAYEKGRLTVVFADTMDHLHALRSVVLQSGVKESDTGWYVGLDSGVYAGGKAAREGQRDKAKAAKVIFATYKMFSEGTDIPWLDTCVLASPRGDVNQIVGRIRREYPGKKTPLVFDVVDNDSPVFASYARSRLKWYGSLGAEVKVYR